MLCKTVFKQSLSDLEKQEIDCQFEATAEDGEYQALTQNLSESFAENDWEVLIGLKAN